MKAKIEVLPEERINILHTEISGLLKNSLQKAFEIGELLMKQKTQLPHGQFEKWITNHLSFSTRTARNYLSLFSEKDRFPQATSISQAYKILSKTETVSDLNLMDILDLKIESSKNCEKLMDGLQEDDLFPVSKINYEAQFLDYVEKIKTKIGDIQSNSSPDQIKYIKQILVELENVSQKVSILHMYDQRILGKLINT